MRTSFFFTHTYHVFDDTNGLFKEFFRMLFKNARTREKNAGFQ